MSTESDGPGGSKGNGVSRGSVTFPLGRLLWYLSCRNKKDTRRRHRHCNFRLISLQKNPQPLWIVERIPVEKTLVNFPPQVTVENRQMST